MRCSGALQIARISNSITPSGRWAVGRIRCAWRCRVAHGQIRNPEHGDPITRGGARSATAYLRGCATADQFTIIALLWFVPLLTGSGVAVGLVIFCFDLPGVVTGAILGHLLDRYQPWLVMGFDNLANQ